MNDTKIVWEEYTPTFDSARVCVGLGSAYYEKMAVSAKIKRFIKHTIRCFFGFIEDIQELPDRLAWYMKHRGGGSR